MYVGKVIGRVWAVKKLDKLPPGALLQIELESSTGADKQQLVALDQLGCGEGERVLVVTGSAAARALGNTSTLIDAVIVASIDLQEGDQQGQQTQVATSLRSL